MKYAPECIYLQVRQENTGLPAGVIPLFTMFHRERHIARKQPLAMK